MPTSAATSAIARSSGDVSGADLHPRLRADCHRLGRLASGELLLHRNAAVPWFIVVPDTTVVDLLDLPEAQRDAVMAQCSRLAAYIRRHHDAERINFAAIGNIVPQLHLHLVGRRQDDPCWPRPVWGHLEEERAYTDEVVRATRERLAGELGLRPAAD